MKKILRALVEPSQRRGRYLRLSLRVLLLLLIPFLLYFPWWTNVSRLNVAHVIDAQKLVDFCIALAGLNATVGAIVIVFVVLAIQELRVLRGLSTSPVELARMRRDKSRLDMLLGVAILSFVMLMLDAVTMLFSLATGLFAPSSMANIGVAGFTYGLASVAVAIYSYRVLEAPFARVSSLSAIERDDDDDDEQGHNNKDDGPKDGTDS
jgi:hypothetical protein